MIFPQEILELILSKCDGKTLTTAKEVSEQFRETIDYLGERTKLWEWCCKEDIPADELTDYLPHYEHQIFKWEFIYANWFAWENQNIKMFTPVLCPNISFNRISSFTTSTNHFAVGSEDGRLKLYSRYFKPINEWRVGHDQVKKLAFIGDNENNTDRANNICLAVAFRNALSILFYDGIRKEQHDIRDVRSHSIYGRFICIEQGGGRITIMEVVDNSNHIEIKEIWFTRIYSPHSITSFNMWKDKCVLLINSGLRIVNYTKPNLTMTELMEKVTHVEFFTPMLLNSSTTRIFRSNVIFNIYRKHDKIKDDCTDMIEDYVEIIIFGKNTHSKKLFNSWEVFKSHVTCSYLFGNTFAIGTACGNIYFYHVDNWKNFDIRKYNYKQIIGKHPIIEIAAKQTSNERIFYVCSTCTTHAVTFLSFIK